MKQGRWRPVVMVSTVLIVLALATAGIVTYFIVRKDSKSSSALSASGANSMDPAAQTIDPVASGLLPATGEVSDLVPDGSYPQAPLAFDQSAVLVDWADADYATVLGLNYKFFEAQWSGPLPKDYRIAWREGGYLDVCDGLVGGSFEAGNYVQSLLSSGEAVGLMSMGAMYWADVYAGTKFENKTNAYWALRELKHSAQWLHDAVMTRPGQALVSVGDLTTFEFYGRPQDAPVPSCNWANATQPASDHVAQASAGLAMAAMLFKNDTAFAATLIDAAKTAFNQSLVSNITADNSFDIGTLYPSYQKDKPAQHQFYAACAIYQATADTTYLDMALQLRVDSVEREGWPVINWDNPYWLGIMCIAHSGPSAEIRATAMARLETMFMTWINELAPIKYTPDGLATIYNSLQTVPWGSLRDVSNVGSLMLQYADFPDVLPATAQQLRCFAKSQGDYILGHNALGISYVVGYTSSVAKVYPLQPHSRDAACGTTDKVCNQVTFFQTGRNNPNVISGGLVSGPAYDGTFADLRTNYEESEVAIDFNAGFANLLAGLAALPATFYATPC